MSIARSYKYQYHGPRQYHQKCSKCGKIINKLISFTNKKVYCWSCYQEYNGD